MPAGILTSIAERLPLQLGSDVKEARLFGAEFPRSGREGPGDAARHALASGLVARHYAPWVSSALGWLHEALTAGQDRRAMANDDYNNALG